ncbi:hypothetical protein KMB89_gp65 [Citrobacter phage HCF1]|uniref:Uncharacterized protein n=1 Tax=Citrobacter phage HCF1 TaxID=2849700 RepID=A0ABX6D759_9CAUD|nr:hypothetical protein KMB89_gp65 [Citrobacter phage HCF1]
MIQLEKFGARTCKGHQFVVRVSNNFKVIRNSDNKLMKGRYKDFLCPIRGGEGVIQLEKFGARTCKGKTFKADKRYQIEQGRVLGAVAGYVFDEHGDRFTLKGRYKDFLCPIRGGEGVIQLEKFGARTCKGKTFKADKRYQIEQGRVLGAVAGYVFDEHGDRFTLYREEVGFSAAGGAYLFEAKYSHLISPQFQI